MARSNGTPVDATPAIRKTVDRAQQRLARTLMGQTPVRADVVETPYDPNAGFFGTRPPGKLCGRCGLRAPPGSAPTVDHDCSHERPCRFLYETTNGVQRATAIECSDCDAAAR